MDEKLRNSLKTLTRVFYDYQDERLSLDGRLGQKKDGTPKKKAPERDPTLLIDLMKRRDDVYAMELEIGKTLAKEVHKHPLWKAFLCDVKGVGETISAVILTEIDIEIATTVSKIWAFAGMAPGKDRKVKGEKCPFNQFLRMVLCGRLGKSFLQCGSPYREFYDNMKHRLESQDWGTASKKPKDKKRPKAGHQHKAATRYMIKMFVRDLYIAWRTLEGLEVRPPYEEGYLGKQHDE